MSSASLRRTFRSLDGQHCAVGELIEPAAAELDTAVVRPAPLISRGAGVCFVAASFGEGVRSIGMRQFNRVIEFDSAAPCITVEAGLSLAELYQATIPRGFYLPVLPGSPQISIGGCVAANVHGKNPKRDGCFVDWVESLELQHPDHGRMVLSRERDGDIFELTCGGLGLTGCIVSVTLRLRSLPSPWLSVRTRAVDSIGATFVALDATEDTVDFVYSWNDLSVFDARIGRGYLAEASFTDGNHGLLRDPQRYPRLDPSTSAKWTPRLFQRWTIPWIARWHRHHELGQAVRFTELYDFVFPGMGFRSANYYAWYGRAGVIAHMVIVPSSRAAEYLDRFHSICRKHSYPILIAATKLFTGKQRLLRFDGVGPSLHLHIPNDPRGRTLAADLETLAAEMRAPRAIYVDSRLQQSDVEVLYPEFDEFRRRLNEFDPKRHFQSALSRRLGL